MNSTAGDELSTASNLNSDGVCYPESQCPAAAYRCGVFSSGDYACFCGGSRCCSTHKWCGTSSSHCSSNSNDGWGWPYFDQCVGAPSPAPTVSAFPTLTMRPTAMRTESSSDSTLKVLVIIALALPVPLMFFHLCLVRKLWARERTQEVELVSAPVRNRRVLPVGPECNAEYNAAVREPVAPVAVARPISRSRSLEEGQVVSVGAAQDKPAGAGVAWAVSQTAAMVTTEPPPVLSFGELTAETASLLRWQRRDAIMEWIREGGCLTLAELRGVLASDTCQYRSDRREYMELLAPALDQDTTRPAFVELLGELGLFSVDAAHLMASFDASREAGVVVAGVVGI